MIKNRKIYLSGKITGLNARDIFDKFDKAFKEVIDLGYVPVNPVETVDLINLKTWKEYMIEDIKELFNCKGVYMITDWNDSKGARIEHFIAQELGMMIIYQK